MGQARAMRGANVLAGVLLSVVLAATGGAGAGCMTRADGHKLTWRTLSKGLTSGMTDARREVIRDEVTFLKRWAEHAAESGRMALPPRVNFEKEMVVIVSMGKRPTGGYLTDVVEAELRGRTLRVLVAEREPVPGLMQIQVVTQPYVMVALPAVRARVEFRTVRESVAGAGAGIGSGTGATSAREAPPATPNRVPTKPTQSPRGSQK